MATSDTLKYDNACELMNQMIECAWNLLEKGDTDNAVLVIEFIQTLRGLARGSAEYTPKDFHKLDKTFDRLYPTFQKKEAEKQLAKLDARDQIID